MNNRGDAHVIRGDARRLPLPDKSVDLIITSPPYWSLRDYGYDEQIGSEPTWRQWLDNLLDCTREWARVLKATGSLFVNLGDSYSAYNRNRGPSRSLSANADAGRGHVTEPGLPGIPAKSLLGLPWRYAIACIDDLGLILRAEIVWNKPNGLPESVTDRVRRSHEQFFHFTKQPRYYAAVDEIREPHARQWGGSPNGGKTYAAMKVPNEKDANLASASPNPLGKLPGSVWSVPSEPLSVPPEVGADHFAAFPTAWPKRLIVGWSPPGICTACGHGRRPVVTSENMVRSTRSAQSRAHAAKASASGRSGLTRDERWMGDRSVTITGYACACTPYTDHPERRGKSFLDHAGTAISGRSTNGPERNRAYREGRSGPSGPTREYHFEDWTPPPTRSAVVLDPMGGTGTTALVASVLGRVGITVDLSADYCRLAQWRVRDRDQIAKALGVAKPPKQMTGQADLFGDLPLGGANGATFGGKSG